MFPCLFPDRTAARTVLVRSCLAVVLFALLGGLAADESSHQDSELDDVRAGVLGTVNVLRELDARNANNLVIAAANVPGTAGSTVTETIDGSAKGFYPTVNAATPLVITYTLPAVRTVASLVIAFESGGDAPATVILEGSTDGGRSWARVFNSRPRKTDFTKFFAPVAVNALRLSLEGGGSRRLREIFVYADREKQPGLFAGKDDGMFSFLREMYYAGKIKQIASRKTAVWSGHDGGKNFPHILVHSGISNFHDGGWGESAGREVGKRLFLRFDFDRAYPMSYGLISNGEIGHILAVDSQAEFYTANGNLDPGTLSGCSIKDLTAQGWVLQKAWDKDPSGCKSFPCARPGAYSQALVVWDGKKQWENNRWSHLELFGAATAEATAGTSK